MRRFGRKRARNPAPGRDPVGSRSRDTSTNKSGNVSESAIPDDPGKAGPSNEPRLTAEGESGSEGFVPPTEPGSATIQPEESGGSNSKTTEDQPPVQTSSLQEDTSTCIFPDSKSQNEKDGAHETEDIETPIPPDSHSQSARAGSQGPSFSPPTTDEGPSTSGEVPLGSGPPEPELPVEPSPSRPIHGSFAASRPIDPEADIESKYNDGTADKRGEQAALPIEHSSSSDTNLEVVEERPPLEDPASGNSLEDPFTEDTGRDEDLENPQVSSTHAGKFRSFRALTN